VPREDTQWKKGQRGGPGGGKKGNPLTRALLSQLNYVPKEAKALGFDEAALIVRQLIKIAKYDNPDYYSNCVQAARELRELGYSDWGKPTQPVDTGFDLGTMIASVAYAVKNPG
jgi:hypothetical protein